MFLCETNPKSGDADEPVRYPCERGCQSHAGAAAALGGVGVHVLFLVAGNRLLIDPEIATVHVRKTSARHTAELAVVPPRNQINSED
jgi:hypothetical protein